MKTVTAIGTGHGSRVELSARSHAFVMDEPEATDLGPNPYEMLLSALGACTVMTVTGYAERKGWPLAHLSVELTHDKVSETNSEGITLKRDLITRVLRLHGALDAEQHKRLLEIADKCPVHKTLSSGNIQITTTTAE